MKISMHNWMRAEPVETTIQRLAKYGYDGIEISYDSVEVLKTFADRQHIGFELLSDPDSKVIRAYGILNETVAKGTPQFGVPYPGTYVLDVNGVVTGKYFADDFRAFLERGARIETQDMHAVEDAPVDRLQPIAGVGQGASHDGREGIGEVALLERVEQIDRLSATPSLRRRRDIFSHSLTRSEGSGPNQVPFLFWNSLCTDLRYLAQQRQTG